MMLSGMQLHGSFETSNPCISLYTAQLYTGLRNAQSRCLENDSQFIVGKPFVQRPTEYKNIEVDGLKKELSSTLSFAISRLERKVTDVPLSKEEIRLIVQAVNIAHHRLINMQGYSALKLYELEEVCKVLK